MVKVVPTSEFRDKSKNCLKYLVFLSPAILGGFQTFVVQMELVIYPFMWIGSLSLG